MSKTKTPTQRDNEILKAAGWTWANGKYNNPTCSVPDANRRVALVLARRSAR